MPITIHFILEEMSIIISKTQIADIQITRKIRLSAIHVLFQLRSIFLHFYKLDLQNFAKHLPFSSLVTQV